jgi:hypothetical protein
MKFFIPFIALFAFLFSCNEDDAPAPDPNKLSTVVGDYIYTVLQGNNQNGAAGQYLAQDIKIIITDLSGRSVNRNFEFELSDATGSVDYSNYYLLYDTVVVRWKLGYNAVEQNLTVTDTNTCGIAKNGCIDVEIFKLIATADM